MTTQDQPMTKLTLEKIKIAAKVYNEDRLCRDFQADEVNKFVQWLYKQYGFEYKE